jgi:hypothetical protein
MTVVMHWTPQRTMWLGMILAALAVIACAVLIWRDRQVDPVPIVASPVVAWPVTTVPRRVAFLAALAGTVLAAMCISPKYALLAALVGLVMVALRRPIVAGVLALALTGGAALLIIRRQLRYDLVANPSWPAAFDDLHRIGLLAVVLLLVATLIEECRADDGEPVT